ncbi:hypothetical protein KAT45_00680 [Candidatus Aerophobetes bacterium]|nr:hypothetical protein [Candidatus Aerophobetes bacterium]
MLSKKKLKKSKIIAAQWHSANDDEVCCLCAHFHGRVFPIYSPELKQFYPPIHEECRCILSYITDRERGVEDRLKEYKPIGRELLKKWIKEYKKEEKKRG